MTAALRSQAAFLVTLVVTAAAALTGQQTRDAPVAAASTASISGTVWSTDDPSVPVGDARVTLKAVDGTFGALAVSDDQGRFAFRDLAAGRFLLETSKAAWLGHAHGASRPGRRGTAIAVAQAQAVAGVRVALTRGAVVSGVVRDERGRPIADASIDVIQMRWADGDRAFESVVNSGSFRTDDTGAYRIFGLPAGESYVLASSMQTSGSQAPLRVMEPGETDRVRRAAQQLGSPLTSPLNVRRASSPARALLSLAPSYFPAASSPATAAAVRLVAGTELPGIDILLPFVETTRLTAVVTTSTGAPSPGTVVTIARVDDGEQVRGAPAGLRITRADGTGRINLTGLFPGVYVARARVVASGDSSTGTMQWADARFVADGRDVDVSLRLQPSMTLSGHAMFEGTSAVATPPRLAFVAVEDPLGGPPAVVPAQGTIAVTLAAGSYRLLVQPGGSRWTVTSATIRGRDILDTPFLMPAGEPIDDLLVRFRDRPTRLTGTLSGATGEAAPTPVIVVFAADRARWRPRSRWIQAARPATNGVFEVLGLPPGDYLLAAVSDPDDGEWFAPDFLDALVPGAVRVTITDGQTITQNLRLGRP